MSDIVPRLDTIEFDQLVEQARGDIPRYAPDWTDHNLHDPGMTLIDLLAWIVDQQVYRAGFVGGRHHRAFAALLGQRSQGMELAHGLIWPVRRVREGRFIEEGSDVICRQHPDLPFSLEWPEDAVSGPGETRTIYFPPAEITTVGVTVDRVERPMPSSLNGGSWALGDGGRMDDTTLSLRFDAPLGSSAGVASVPLGIHVAPPPGPPLAQGDRPWGPVIFSYRVGASRWVELRVVHDGTAGLARTGVVLLALPQAGFAEAGSSEVRLSFDRGFFPVPPQVRDVQLNVIPIVQRIRVRSALLDTGTGQPDQVVMLDTSDCIAPPSRPHGPVLEVEVNGTIWDERPDFSRSGPSDPHYVVQPGHIVFGNGVNGRRPEAGAQIQHTELARTLGAAGNVRRGLSWSVPAMGVDGFDFGLNRDPLTGGQDTSGVDDLARAARHAATRRSATLTDDELRAAAGGLTGMAVGRAEVVAGFDRRLSNRRINGVRTLVVVPQLPVRSGDERLSGPIQISQAYLDEVAARLEPRRLLGERLIVQGPVTVSVTVSLTITTEPWTEVEEVKTAVERAIRGRLSALPASDGVQPWPLGRDLTVTEVQGIAANVPGVGTVSAAQVATTGERLGHGPVQVPPDGLVVADRIEIFADAASHGPGRGPLRSEGGRGSR